LSNFLNGTVSLQYRKEEDILYAKDLGCLTKGKAVLDIPCLKLNKKYLKQCYYFCVLLPTQAQA